MVSKSFALDQVVVIGAGLMGHGIGLVHALGGCEVILHDLDATVLDTALERSRAAGMALVEFGLIDQAELDRALEGLHIESDPAKALAGADMVVEAIVEEAEAKRSAYAMIDHHAPQEAIIASNTSYLDIFPLVPARRQARTLIVHWYAPPHAIDLVDVVRGPETQDGLAEAICDLLKGFGKKPVLMRQFIHGYIANRIQTAISLEVFHLLDAGLASIEQIDSAIRHGIAQRLALQGHLGRLDFAGLKVTQLNLSNKAYVPPAVRGRSDIVDRLVAEGRLGVTAGAGFYDYEGWSAEDLLRERDRKLFALKRAVERIEHIDDTPRESKL